MLSARATVAVCYHTGSLAQKGQLRPARLTLGGVLALLNAFSYD